MARSKTIKLFLMDGEPSGRIKCSLANWTGIAYRIPRTEVDKCKELEILKQSGVYFLFGTDSDDNPVVYITKLLQSRKEKRSERSGSL